MRILFMCTANSCRSILSEAAFNHLAPPGFEAVSAGSFPKGQVLPRSMLSRRSHPAQVNTSRASCCSTARPESVRSAACWLLVEEAARLLQHFGAERVLGRWMRMVTIPNQQSVPKAYMEFDEADRMKPSAYYDRVGTLSRASSQ